MEFDKAGKIIGFKNGDRFTVNGVGYFVDPLAREHLNIALETIQSGALTSDGLKGGFCSLLRLDLQGASRISHFDLFHQLPVDLNRINQ